jgi:hypothetical protein
MNTMVQQWYNAGYHTLYFRPGVEFNLGDGPCHGDSACSNAQYVQAFQEIFTALHADCTAIGATCKVMWDPGITQNNVVADGQSPGANYMDVMAGDYYSTYSGSASNLPN